MIKYQNIILKGVRIHFCKFLANNSRSIPVSPKLKLGININQLFGDLNR